MKTKQGQLFELIFNNANINQIAQIISEGAKINGLHNGQLALISAIQQGNYPLTEFLLDNGALINSIDGMQTALISSIWSPNPDIFNLLIKRGADINQSDNSGMNPLVSAINSRKEDIIETLLEHKDINVNPKTNMQTPLVAAVIMSQDDDIKLIETLVKMGADVNPITDNQTPLSAASMRNLAAVKFLLTLGAEINPVINNNTPLTQAVMGGSIDIVELLIAQGAKVNPIGIFQTPLLASIQLGKEDMFNLLIQKGADVNLKPENYQTPLNTAIMQGRAKMAIKLINQGAKVVTSDNGVQVLESLIWNPDIELLKLLIEKGADINAKNPFDNKTILDKAIENGKNDIAEILKEHGAEASPIIAPQQVVDNFIAEQATESLIAEPYVWIDPMIAKTKELEQAIEKNDIQTIDKIIQENYWGNFDWSLIKNVIIPENQESLKSLLITAIKHKWELAKVLIENEVGVDQKDLMNILCGNHPINYNMILPMLLEQKHFKIDWNQEVDENGNNLMMYLLSKHLEWLVFNLIPMKDAKGLPIFEINHTNKHGHKLIDLCKLKLDNNLMIKEGIFLLRKLGSSEPTSLIMPCYTLNTQNVHDERNEKIIQTLMKEMRSKHQLDTEAFKKNIASIEEYINNNKARLCEELEDQDLITVVERLKMLQMKDTYPSNEHNTQWLFTEELGYIYSQAMTNGRLDEFVKKLACLPEGSCNWGFLVNIYSAVEEEKGADHPPIIQFHKFMNSDVYFKVADKAIELLKESGLSAEQIKVIVSKFHKEVAEKRNEFQNVSIESEFLKGIFHKLFIGFVQEAGNDESDIYSDDCIKFYEIVQVIVGDYEFSDDYNETKFYEILHEFENELNINVSGDINNLDLSQ